MNKVERRVENFEEDSMHKLWGAESKLSKVEIYKWNKPGVKGEFTWIPKDQLKIDLSYQRDADGKKRISDIARNFNWALFGVILIALNDEGYYVIDGGTRTRAACRREDIKELPCMVFIFNDIAEEARIFWEFNILRKTVNIFDRHKAALVANNELAIKAEKLVNKYGYSVVKNSASEFQIKAINTVYRMIELDENLADKTFSVISKVAEGLEIQSNEMMGLFYLMQTNRTVDFYTFPLENLISAGIGKIRESIKRISLIEGKGGVKVSAKALAEIINKGQQKTKVFVP